MLVIKNLTTHYRPYRTISKYVIGFKTLHHLLIMEAHLTGQQRENAWLLLGREEIPDLYAHLIGAQLQEPDGNAVTGMAAVLEGHTQAVSQISRHPTAPDETICHSLALLDMMCPRGWTRDKEATGEMPRWIHEQTGAGQWDFPNLMKFEVNILSGQPLNPSTMDDWSDSSKIWAPINCNMSTLLHILFQHHPLGSLSEFRNNSLISLQQRSPHGISLGPQSWGHPSRQKEQKDQSSDSSSYGPTNTRISITFLPLSMPGPCEPPDSDGYLPKTGRIE